MAAPLGILSYPTENIGNFEHTDAFSVEIWFYQTSVKTTTLVSHIDDSVNKRGWMINTWGPGRNIGMVLVNNIDTNYLHVRTGSTQFVVNTWNHLIFTYDGTGQLGSFKCYVNNVSKVVSVMGANTLTGTIKSDMAKLLIGHGSIYQFFPGRLDEVVIYDRVLSAAEVAQRYNGGAGTETLFGDAYLQYHINEANGVAILDSTINHRHSMIVNGPSRVPGKLSDCIQLDGVSQYISS